MSRQYFIPSSDDEFRKNYGLYAAQITKSDSPYVAKYDIAAATVALVGDDQIELTQAHDALGDARAEVTRLEGVYEAVKARVTGHWTGEAGDIKRHKEFTDSDGEALKILGPEVSDNFSDKNPKLRLEVVPEGVKIMFTKSGADGINLYCQRAGNPAPVFVRFVSMTGWIDAQANLVGGQDESRQYSACLVYKDHEVGQISTPAPVSVRPRA